MKNYCEAFGDDLNFAEFQFIELLGNPKYRTETL